MTTIAENILLLKQDFDEVYEAGYLKGQAEGGGEDNALMSSLIDRSITEIDIPDGVTKVGSTAFANCTKLVRISIPDSVTDIGSSAFQSVPITELIVPLGCKTVSSYSFANMPKLESIKLGDVNLVRTQAFSNDTLCLTYDFTRCTAVPQLDNVDAFAQINAQAKIIVPTSLYYEWVTATNWTTYIDYIITDGVLPTSEGLEYTLTYGGNSYSVSGIGTCADTNIIIPERYNGLAVTSIGPSAFADCTSLTGMMIPNSVINIGSNAFSGCTSLKSVIIPNSVTSIDYWAFSYCTSLKSVIIPNSVTSIGEGAFDHCASLESVVIGDSVTNIGEHAFRGCASFESITVDKNNTVYHSAGNCLIETENKTLIRGCKNSIIPDDGSVTSIGDYAFSDCTSLTSIEIPDSVMWINQYAFYGCASLEFINIPDSVKWIGNHVFVGCINATLYFTSHKSIPTISSDDVFDLSDSVTIYVPKELYERWIKATNWVAYADYIVATDKQYEPSEGLEYQFYSQSETYAVVGMGGCTDEVLIIPEEHYGYPVTSINMNDVDTVKEIILSDTITTVHSSLGDCDILERVSFGAGFEQISYWAFNGNVNCREYDFSRCQQIPSMNFYETEPDTFSDMPEDCRMIVPDRLYDEWVTTPNWENFADHIIPVSAA